MSKTKLPKSYISMSYFTGLSSFLSSSLSFVFRATHFRFAGVCIHCVDLEFLLELFHILVDLLCFDPLLLCRVVFHHVVALVKQTTISTQFLLETSKLLFYCLYFVLS